MPPKALVQKTMKPSAVVALWLPVEIPAQNLVGQSELSPAPSVLEVAVTLPSSQ